MRTVHARQLLLDAGALRDAEKHPRGRLWAICEAEITEGRQPLLPVLVLAQMWRGGAAQAGLARVVKACRLVHIDQALAHRIGVLLGAAGTADVVDAMVVLAAGEANAAVVTSDPSDIAKLADAANLRIPVIVV